MLTAFFRTLSQACCAIVKPGLHIVITIAEYVSDDASRGNLKLSTCRLQIFFVEDQYLRSFIQQCSDQSISVQPEKHATAILTTYMETRLN